MKIFDFEKKNRKEIYEIEMNVALTQNVNIETFIDLKYEKKKKLKKFFDKLQKKLKKNVKRKN